MPREPLCPFCGRFSPGSCGIEAEIAGASCPWEDSDLDPDLLREDRDERRRIEKETPDGQ